MKCSICGNEAVHYVPYERLYLCKEHYAEWFEQKLVRNAKRYRMFDGSRRVAVAVSGGKDSTTLLHVLKKHEGEFGFTTVGFYIDLGIDRGTKYSEVNLEVVKRNFEEVGVEYRIVDLKGEYGFTIDDAKRRINRPVCSTCGVVKRYLMTLAAEELGADTLATAHNLDDMAQFVLSGYVYGNLEHLSRNSPVEEPERGFKVKKVKPFFLHYEYEVLHYAVLMGYQFVYDPCPYSEEFRGVSQHKLLMSMKRIEGDTPGFMLNLVSNFERNIRPMLYREISGSGQVGTCKICGRPTAPGRDICSFCSIKQKMLAVRG